MVTAKKRDALAKYTAGQTMILRPFPNPGPPHSMGIFPKPVETASDGRSFEDYTAQQPSNFDPDIQYEDDELLKLNIVETISGGEVTTDKYCFAKPTRPLAQTLDIRLFPSLATRSNASWP